MDDADYPASPYPGARPAFSFAHDEGGGHEVRPSPWRVGSVDVDAWLAERSSPPLAARVPLLSYGSNACPSKLTWLRAAHGLAGPVVVLRARSVGVSAVWAAGLRVVDDQRPAVLASAPGVVEDHALIMASVEQVRAFDECEGRGDRYLLADVRCSVTTEDGARWDTVLAYVGAREVRRPLVVGGRFVACSAVSQVDAVRLVGVPAGSDGLDATAVSGAPDPRDYPGRLFVYGTLQPGATAWHLLSPHAAGPGRPARLPGTLYDTGQGYPALRPGAGPGVTGWAVPLRSGASLDSLDEYEGPEYARVRVALTDGSVAWAYAWRSPVDGLPVLTTPWPTTDPIR